MSPPEADDQVRAAHDSGSGAGKNRRFRPSLGLKIGLPISLLVAAVLAVYVYINDPRDLIGSQKQHEAERLAAIVRSIVAREMVAGEPWNVQEHLELIDCGEDIEHLRVVDWRGELRYGLGCEELGISLDRDHHPDCQRCHVLDPPPQSLLWKNEEGESRFTFFSSIVNEEVCRNCHVDDPARLGEIIVQLKISEAELAELSTRRRLAATGAVMILLAISGIAAFIHFLVTRPVRSLVQATREVEIGNFSPDFPFPRNDELGELTVRFQEMAGRLGAQLENQERLIEERTEELQRSQQQVLHQEKMASLGRLTAGVAHEIGNPLASISAMVQLLERTSQEERTREQARELGEHVQRINRIVRELVDLHRPSHANADWTDVGRCIESALRIARYDRSAKGVRIQTRIDDGMVRVHLVEDHLLQVLLNLILNAIDAMPHGGELRVEAQMNGGAVELKVADSGTGIAAEDLERIFDPFYTTKSPGKGTGLGLWVSYSLVQRWRGTIRFESETGRGTTATLTIPVHDGKRENGSEDPDHR